MIVPKPLHDSGRPIHGNPQMPSKTVRQEIHICENSWVALQMHASLSGTINLLSMLKRSWIYTYPPSDRRQAQTQSSWPWRGVSAGRVPIVLCLFSFFTSCEKSTSCAHQCWMKQNQNQSRDKLGYAHPWGSWNTIHFCWPGPWPFMNLLRPSAKPGLQISSKQI